MLYNKTSSWRNIKPVIDGKRCTGCMICWKYCPEAAIKIAGKNPVVNYDYCKGCGICANECPRSSIEMVVEDK
ncbi:MAG: 4Fe-4S binding protein [Eubacteriales bacterium]|nr:4Fe-4S binding protein [Eubacteriales bacterium]